MHILFLSKGFFEYDNNIRQSLEKLGHEVKNFIITPEQTTFKKIKRRLCKTNDEETDNYNYQRRMLEEIKKDRFDVVFVLAGQGLLKSTIEEIRVLNRNAVFCWYIWDSIDNLKNYRIIKDCFDLIISFDTQDAFKEGLIFQPLFYIYGKANAEKDIDISMIATDRQDRRSMIEKMLRLPFFNKSFFYLKTGRFEAIKYYLLCSNKQKQCCYIRTKSLPYKKVMEIMQRSRIVIDVPAKNQSGLTMRTIEALGCRAKLITTNTNVIKYDFYNSNNVLVIDSKNPVIPPDFLINSYVDIADDILKKYSIDGWCNTLIKHINGVTEKNVANN